MCVFQSLWLDQDVDNIPVISWCAADPSNKDKAKCLTCPAKHEPFGKTFSVKEGFTAVKKHARTAIHMSNYKAVDEAAEEGFEQINLEAAFKNQEELNKRQVTENRQLLEGQILFSNFVHAHGLPSSCFTCFGDLAHRIFPDSNIAKKLEWYERWYATNQGRLLSYTWFLCLSPPKADKYLKK